MNELETRIRLHKLLTEFSGYRELAIDAYRRESDWSRLTYWGLRILKKIGRDQSMMDILKEYPIMYKLVKRNASREECVTG